MENAPRVNGEKTMNMATQPNSPDRTANKTSIVNRPYIRKETINTVVDRDGNDSMRMEEMPAGKSEEQIESERVGRVKINDEMQARMKVYWADKRANEQKNNVKNKNEFEKKRRWLKPSIKGFCKNKEKKFKMHIIEILKMNLMKSKIMKWKWRCRI